MSMKTLKVLPMLALLALVMLAFALANTNTAQAWLHHGPTVQYPSTGGKWTYGFWNARVRSYYTVNRCHGSTVYLNGGTVRSPNTAPGYTSVATKYAIDGRNTDDRYYYRIC